MPFPPEKIWRALTEPHLIEEWLMKKDFKPVVDHGFKLSADGAPSTARSGTVEPGKTLSYTWAAYGRESVVTWTLTPTGKGTHLRMEHRASEGISSRPTRAPDTGGRSSLQSWNRCWRGSSEAFRKAEKRVRFAPIRGRHGRA